MNEPALLGGIEAGGTKFVCAVAEDPKNLFAETRFKIRKRTPEYALRKVIQFFSDNGPISALGIGTFGPADLNQESESFGSIMTTPKAGWAGFDFVGAVRDGLGVDLPIVFETDVNAAAIGEAWYGSGKGKANVCYVTVGTGIGGGFLHEGKPLHGRMHPEIGHMLIPTFDNEFGVQSPGSDCDFHANCLEGRASGEAMCKLWKRKAPKLPANHRAWDLEALYLAHAAINLTSAWSPDVIVFGGGVFQQEHLIDKVRAEFAKLTGDYWENLPPVDEYLTTADLGQNAGIVGALKLAADIG